MGRDIIDIIKEKEYHQLTSDERDEVKEICTNEEEYYQMKSIFLSVDSFSEEGLMPSGKTKERLDELFIATYPKASPVWYNSVLAVVVPKDKPIYRQPLFQLASACMLLFLVFYIPNVNLTDSSMKMAQAEQVDEEPIFTESPSVVDAPKTENKLTEADDVLNDQQRVIMESETRTVTVFDRSEAVEESLDELSSSFASGTSSPSIAPLSVHPDGVFVGNMNDESSVSMSAAESADLLDLLTATF